MFVYKNYAYICINKTNPKKTMKNALIILAIIFSLTAKAQDFLVNAGFSYKNAGHFSIERQGQLKNNTALKIGAGLYWQNIYPYKAVYLGVPITFVRDIKTNSKIKPFIETGITAMLLTSQNISDTLSIQMNDFVLNANIGVGIKKSIGKHSHVSVKAFYAQNITQAISNQTYWNQLGISLSLGGIFE
jgi:hypothetical protein